MKVTQIVVLKESRVGEGRVALTPTAVSILMKINLPIMVESSAGALAGFTDEEYKQAGASIFTLDSPLPEYSFILRVKCPTVEREIIENKLFPTNTIMMGFLDPLNDDTSHIDRWKSLGWKLISLELLPLHADDPRNAQAAMSHFAGGLALQDALNHYQGFHPKKVTVIGTGPAGMGAALTARDLQLPTQLFGRREEIRKIAEKAGIIYYVLPENSSRDFLRQYLSDQTIIVTAARNIGKRSPRLIEQVELNILPEYAVLADLSTGEGGNVLGSKHDEKVIVDRGIAIVNVSGYPKAEPRAASMAFSSCMQNLLLELITASQCLDLHNPLLMLDK